MKASGMWRAVRLLKNRYGWRHGRLRMERSRVEYLLYDMGLTRTACYHPDFGSENKQSPNYEAYEVSRRVYIGSLVLQSLFLLERS